jgi:hypothetical protein
MMIADVTVSVTMAEQIMWVLSNLMKEEPLPDKKIVSFSIVKLLAEGSVRGVQINSAQL